MATLNTSSNKAGTKAPRKTFWVLTIWVLACVIVSASVCARISASPSRISTGDGGTTTPSVLATHTRATAGAAGVPAVRSGGKTARVSIATLPPTDPFMGPSKAPSPKAAVRGAAGLAGNAAVNARNNVDASGKRVSRAPIST